MVVTSIVHTFNDWPGGEAVYGALTVFIAGCDLGCKGCHNAWMKTIPPDALHSTPNEVLHRILARRLDFPDHKLHVVLSGGDPLSAANYPETAELVELLVQAGAVVTVYTGRQYGNVSHLPIGAIRYLKCGKYDRELSQPSGHFDGEFRLASTNQILYDTLGNRLSTNGVYRYQ